MNSLSRAVESALQMEGVPHVVLGGHRFFERMEVGLPMTSGPSLYPYIEYLGERCYRISPGRR